MFSRKSRLSLVLFSQSSTRLFSIACFWKRPFCSVSIHWIGQTCLRCLCQNLNCFLKLPANSTGFAQKLTMISWLIIASKRLQQVTKAISITMLFAEDSPTTRQFRSPTFVFQSHPVFNGYYRGNKYLYMSRSL